MILQAPHPPRPHHHRAMIHVRHVSRDTVLQLDTGLHVVKEKMSQWLPSGLLRDAVLLRR
jgi:hypothetical protein